MKKGLFIVLALLALGAVIVGMVTAQSRRATTTFDVTLNGANEVPGPGDPEGFGSGTLTVDDASTTGNVCFTGTVSGITFPATAMHVHVGAAGASGGPIVFFNTLPADGTFNNVCGDADEATVTAILADPTGHYLNIHNDDFPNGAVRGQLEPQQAETSTPTVDATLPGETPTTDATVAATATTDPNVTPTATATEFPGTELLLNGGFENDLAPWEVKNETGDKIKCNKDKDGDGVPDKIFAYEGTCAFRFKGGTGEASKLVQTVDLTTVTNGAGDIVTLRGWAESKNLTGNSNAKVKVKYADVTAGENGDGKDKVKYEFLPQTAPYYLFTADALTFADTVTQVKVQFSNKTIAGKLLLDGISLRWEDGVEPTATVDLTATTEPTVETTATAEPTLDLTATVDATATTEPTVEATSTTALVPLP
jgi:hypothetical protein